MNTLIKFSLSLMLFSVSAQSQVVAKSAKENSSLSHTSSRLNLKMHVFAAAKNRWIITQLLKRKLSKRDFRILMTKTRQYKVKLKDEFNAEFLPKKRAYKIEGYPSLFYISKSGKALKYKDQKFKYNTSLNVSKNLERIQKKLSQSSSDKFSWINYLFFNKAHADDYALSNNAASLDILSLLGYMEYYGTGGDYYETLMYLAENEPEMYNAILRLYNSNGQKKIKSITCDNDYRMTVHFVDGTSGVMNWNGKRGSDAGAELTSYNGSWNPIQMQRDQETTVLNGQYFFCQMQGGEDTSQGQAVIQSLNEMIAPEDYGTYGEGDSGSGGSID